MTPSQDNYIYTDDDAESFNVYVLTASALLCFETGFSCTVHNSARAHPVL